MLIFIALQKANLIPCAYDYDFAMVTAFGIMVIMKEKYALSLLLSEMRAKFPLKSIAHWFKVHVANVAVLPMVQGRAKVTTTENPVTESRLFDTLVVKISCVIKILYII